MELNSLCAKADKKITVSYSGFHTDYKAKIFIHKQKIVNNLHWYVSLRLEQAGHSGSQKKTLETMRLRINVPNWNFYFHKLFDSINFQQYS